MRLTETALDTRGDASHEIRRLEQVPSELRDFTVSSSDAERQFGLTWSMLDELAAAGLPYRDGPNGRRFSGADLAYLGIRLGTAQAHLTKFALLAKSLTRFAAHESVGLTVHYVPLLAAGSGSVPGMIALPEGGHREVELVHDEVAAEVSIMLGSWHPPTPARLARALAEMGPLNLYELPAALLGDVAFSRRTGLSECFTAAQMVGDCCRSAGYEARVSEGLLVSIPWSSAHYWAEARVEGTWLPLDPLMIRAMRQFGSLKPDVWPLHRSPAPMLARFPSGTFPLVAAKPDGSRVNARLLTSIDRAS